VFDKKKIEFLKRSFATFFLLVFTVIAFKFLFFTSFIKSQKRDFRKQLIEHSSEKIFDIKIALKDLLIDKPGFDWKEKGKELVINGVYHEVIKIRKDKEHVIVSLIEDSKENEMFNRYFCLNKDMQNDYSELMELLLDFDCIDQRTTYSIQMFFVKNETSLLDVTFSESDFLKEIIKPPRS